MSLQIESTRGIAVDASNEVVETGEPDLRNRGLESKAIRATLWTVMDYGSAMTLRVVNSLVLTRLLMPESFGLMTLVTTLVVGISLMSDIGLTPSVIRSSRGDDPVFLNTAFTVQTLRGFGIFIIALLLTWPLAHFYHQPKLLLLIPALGFNTIITAFNSTNLLSMSRHMGVRRLFFLDFSTQIVSLIVTSTIAWFYPTVWSLAFGTMFSNIYRMVMSHNKWAIPGIKNTFAWDRDSVQELVHFGKWIILATAFYFFASQSDRLILGKLIPLSLLGVYGIAYSVSDIPRAVMNAFTQKVGFPVIARIAEQPIDSFRKAFLRYRFPVLIAGAFLLTLMVHLGGYVVTHVYDHRYEAAGWMVPILALGLWHTLLYSTTMTSLFSLGKSKYAGMGNGAYCATVVTGIPLAFHFYGLIGAVVVVAAGDFPLYVVATSGASREHVSTWRQDILATMIFLSMLGVGFAIRKLVIG